MCHDVTDTIQDSLSVQGLSTAVIISMLDRYISVIICIVRCYSITYHAQQQKNSPLVNISCFCSRDAQSVGRQEQQLIMSQ